MGAFDQLAPFAGHHNSMIDAARTGSFDAARTGRSGGGEDLVSDGGELVGADLDGGHVVA